MLRLSLGVFLGILWSAQGISQGALKNPPIPADNPMTADKIELGKKLFFDPRLSKTQTVSCNSCHNVMAGGEDNRNFSAGINGQLGGRSSPTVWNSAYFSVLFWDGRAASLEEQAKGPLINPVEMGMADHRAVEKRVQGIAGYAVDFVKVFGPKNAITIDNIAKAIAAYERTLNTLNSPYDRFVNGDKKAISEEAKRGLELVTNVGCLSCHNGPHFSGPITTAGQGFYQKFPTIPDTTYDKTYGFSKDLGRFEATKNPADKNMFRVPTWRNISVTAPYFHNGSVKTLGEAVKVMAKTQLNRDLTDAEVRSIVAFLETLTGQFPEQKMPRLPATYGMVLE